VVYLVILVVVAVAALVRLWLQQRREQTQMDTIEGFSSALDAMAPPSRPARRERPSSGNGRPSSSNGRLRVPKAPRPSLLGWFVADKADRRARSAARRRTAVRAAAQRRAEKRAAALRRDAALAAGRRRDEASSAARGRAVRNGEIRLPDSRPSTRALKREAPRRIPVASGSASDDSRFERYAG
jgi:hypothetical protein